MGMEQEDEKQQGETVEFEDSLPDVEDTEDGGAIIRLDEEEDLARNQNHFANIVDEVDPADLRVAVDDLLDKISKDKDAREKRDKLYEEGLRRTGLGDDAPGGAQFTGASKVVHPMLIEACVDFAARVSKEILPPSGPVKTKIVGEPDKKKVEKAERKADFMNWQTTQQIPEFRGEIEQLLTQLPLGGGQYLKGMWNPQHRRPGFEFVPIDDIYLPFAATNFYTAERKTHVQYITAMEYKKRVKAGMYIDVDLPSPEEPEFSAASKANDKIEGRTESSYNEDGLRTIFEVYTYLDFGDGVEPYIISIDKSTSRALSLYRNWDKDDELRCELDWIVEWGFIPWRGAYPIGLTHMIGGLSGAATGALRALLDSAHINNIPGMLKLKGGPNGQTLTVQPTEVVEIEGGVGIDDIRKIAMPIPYNPPSPVLYQLLGFLIDAGKGVVQTSFEKLADQNPNAPVGTTLALIEQGMVVFSSIHTRMHEAMGRTLKILHRINSAYLTEEDILRQAGEMEIRPSDFDGPMDVVPVSDPHIFSEAQRFAQIQALQQRAAALPQLYDVRKVEEKFLHQIKVEADDVLLPAPGQDDMDPVSENVAAAMGRPIYVLPKQEHVAHLQIHMGFLQSPLFGANPVIAQTFMPAIVNHLRDHLLNYYLTEAHKAVKDAGDQQLITAEDAAQETQLILQVQQIIEQEMQKLAQIMPQVAQEAQKYAPPPMPQDPTMAVAQLRAQQDDKKLAAEQQKLVAEQQQDDKKLAAEQALAVQKLQLEQQADAEQRAIDQERLRLERERLNQSAAEVQFREQAEDMRNAETNATRERMNASDNETAMRLAAAEIASGEKVAVSTGGGINPGV